MEKIYYRAFIERVTLVLAGIGIVAMALLGGCRKELSEELPKEGTDLQSLDSLLRVVGVMPMVDSTGYLPRQEACAVAYRCGAEGLLQAGGESLRGERYLRQARFHPQCE